MPGVHLGSHYERYCADRIRSGRYQNVSEVVRAALRQMEDAEARAAVEKRQAAKPAPAKKAK